jgi:microcystin-dependent protein
MEKNKVAAQSRMTSVLRKNSSKMATERATVGDTKFSAVNSDHMGWLKCDGRALSVADYNLLFRVIGYSFSAVKSGTTFNLPDAEGRVPAAIGTSGGATWALGDVSGSETHTLTIAQMPSHNHGTNASDTVVGNNLTGLAGGHTHTITDPGHTHTGTPNQASTAINGASNNTGNGGTTSSSTTGITINSVADHQHSIATQGGDDPHNNIQPTIWMGSLFMFCGVLSAGSYPLTNGTNII